MDVSERRLDAHHVIADLIDDAVIELCEIFGAVALLAAVRLAEALVLEGNNWRILLDGPERAVKGFEFIAFDVEIDQPARRQCQIIDAQHRNNAAVLDGVGTDIVAGAFQIDELAVKSERALDLDDVRLDDIAHKAMKVLGIGFERINGREYRCQMLGKHPDIAPGLHRNAAIEAAGDDAIEIVKLHTRDAKAMLIACGPKKTALLLGQHRHALTTNGRRH